MSETVFNTFVIDRTYPAPVERVFTAFADPEKRRRWFAEGHSHEVTAYETEFRVGGVEHVRYVLNDTTPFPGTPLESVGQYHDIVPNERIVMAGTMSFGDRRISSALLTIELVPTDDGTNLVCTHQAAFFEGADGPQMREMGWQKLFDKLGDELGR